jgi:hypothetical protein
VLTYTFIFLYDFKKRCLSKRRDMFYLLRVLYKVKYERLCVEVISVKEIPELRKRCVPDGRILRKSELEIHTV